MTLDDIYSEIKNSNSFVLLTHENPDGDAIGSVCAMLIALKNLGKTDIDVYMKEWPEIYGFIPELNMIKKVVHKKRYDVAIVLDCANIERVSNIYRDVFENAKIKIQIDHHNKNTMFADYNFVNPASASCTQILANGFDYLNIDITKEIATCILTGIITDTCGFSTPETSSDCFDFASMALTKGVNISKIYRESFSKISIPRFMIQRLATERMEFMEDGKIAYTYITKEDEKEYGTQTGDLATIVEIGKNIKGVEVSIFIYERENGYKVSIRSNEYVDASLICLTLGGGGHLRAGGVNLQTTLEEAKELILTETKKHLK